MVHEVWEQLLMENKMEIEILNQTMFGFALVMDLEISGSEA